MKKHLFPLITALAATLFTVVNVSCQKDRPDNGYSEPVYSSHAQVLNLQENPLGISLIELTEAGRYIITFAPSDVKSNAEPTSFQAGTYMLFPAFFDRRGIVP